MRKKILLCTVIAIILSFTTINGASVEKTIKVLYNDVKIYVDGKLIQPKDANGNKVEPIIYNGTTYLPIRAIGNAIDKNVKWEAKTNSIYIGKYDTTKPSIYLNQLDYFNYQDSRYCDFNYWSLEEDKDSTGKNYEQGLKFSIEEYFGGEGENWVYNEYLLNQKYKTFKGTFVLHYDDRTRNDKTHLKIYGDDNLLYTSPVMKSGVLPIDFNVDVTGVIKLKVQLVSTSYSGKTTTYGIVNPGLYE